MMRTNRGSSSPWGAKPAAKCVYMMHAPRSAASLSRAGSDSFSTNLSTFGPSVEANQYLT